MQTLAGLTAHGPPSNHPELDHASAIRDAQAQRPDYEAKLADYTQDLVSDGERARFIEAVNGMDSLSGDELATINLIVDAGSLEAPETRGIY